MARRHRKHRPLGKLSLGRGSLVDKGLAVLSGITGAIIADQAKGYLDGKGITPSVLQGTMPGAALALVAGGTIGVGLDRAVARIGGGTSAKLDVYSFIGAGLYVAGELLTGGAISAAITPTPAPVVVPPTPTMQGYAFSPRTLPTGMGFSPRTLPSGMGAPLFNNPRMMGYGGPIFNNPNTQMANYNMAKLAGTIGFGDENEDGNFPAP